MVELWMTSGANKLVCNFIGYPVLRLMSLSILDQRLSGRTDQPTGSSHYQDGRRNFLDLNLDRSRQPVLQGNPATRVWSNVEFHTNFSIADFISDSRHRSQEASV